MSDPGDSSGIDGGSETEPDERPCLELDIVADSGDWSAIPDVEDLVKAAAQAVAAAPELVVGTVEVAVALSGDEAVRALNLAYRGQDKATNVLSFPAPAGLGVGPGSPRFLGDVMLAAGVVLREAEEQAVTPAHHLQHLVVHGLLHLLGFDHETNAEAERMESLETRILARLGIADPYAEPAA